MLAPSAAQFALLPGFALYMLIGSITPGPNNIMILASGANFGIRRSLPHLWGISLGFAFMLLVVGLGLGALFLASPTAQMAIRVAGLGYIVWLAWRIATAGGLGEAQATQAPLSFAQAALFQWVNIKAWMLVTGAVAVYTAPGEAALATLPLLALICVAMNLPSIAVWLVLGVGIRRLLAQPVALRAFNLTMAALLLASVLPMLLHRSGRIEP